MKRRLSAILNVGLICTAAALGVALTGTPAGADDKPAAAPAKAASPTEDIIYMTDGRELHGQIVSKTRTQVVFEYADPKLNMKTKLTLSMDDIVKIDENVKLSSSGEAAAETPAASSSTATIGNTDAAKSKASEEPKTYGAAHVITDDPKVPSFYIVPMRGQMGTDVRAEVYADVIKDIRETKPTYVILDISCSDTSDLMHPTGYEPGPRSFREAIREWGLLEFDNYRELVNMFRDGLRDVPQAVWIHDSDGVSAIVSMAWDKIFMSPKARFGSKISVVDFSGASGWADPDIRAKMTAAWLGIAQGFLEKGGYSPQLAHAMIDSDPFLSATWSGRQVVWSNETSGEVLVDGSPDSPAYMSAKNAEDLCISKGSVEDLDDMALLLGYRKYRVIDSKQYALTVGYVEKWRRVFAEAKQSLEDFNLHMSRAQGADAVKFLGQAKSDLESVVNAIDRYRAVELRLGSDLRINKTDLIARIEQLAEQIRALRRTNAADGGGGNGGGGRAGGRSGGGRTPG